MSKSILVIDTPENCRECPCHFTDMVGFESGKEKFFRFLCGVKNREITENVNTDRQDWCPLLDFPKEKYFAIEYCVGNKENCIESYVDGYNACIDEILKGGEQK